MLEGFPNLHPLVVHFPIALILGAVVADFGCLLLRTQWLDRVAGVAWLFGTLGAGGAFLSGRDAASSVGAVGKAQIEMYEHGDLGLYTLIAAVVVTLLRLLIVTNHRGHDRLPRSPMRLAAFVFALGVAGLLVETARHGGKLVFEHGLGVSAVEESKSRIEDAKGTAEAAERRVQELEALIAAQASSEAETSQVDATGAEGS